MTNATGGEGAAGNATNATSNATGAEANATNASASADMSGMGGRRLLQLIAG